ncbi:MAG: hypothetical protein HC857_15825 [Synechococcales cyanobacterium RU_4_20]|nr:hypothetical protein [Synechococcales cyanobacterium RU_4_20]
MDNPSPVRAAHGQPGDGPNWLPQCTTPLLSRLLDCSARAAAESTAGFTPQVTTDAA